jgi:hypothetical protein
MFLLFDNKQWTTTNGQPLMKTFPATLFILLIIMFLCSCASIPRTIPLEHISLSEAEKITSDIEAQGDLLRSFYTLGVISIKGWLMDSDADILIAGIKDPFAIKIEITHSWGIPILHVLIKDNRLEVLSFQEKTFYQGAFTPDALSRFLPGFNLDQEMIWALLSGRPPIVTHESIVLSGPDRISLTDRNNREIETIYLPVKKYIPIKISFPVQSLDISFSDIKEANGISYAGKVDLNGIKGGKDLGLKINELSPNASLPDQIFTMEKFSSYKMVNLDDLPEDPDKQ